jgi:hypothetical protein
MKTSQSPRPRRGRLAPESKKHLAPWEWHITETYKGLITISVGLTKMLALVNGGAAVAILAYLSNTHSTHPALMAPALQSFCSGLFLVTLALFVAYLTQLRLYNEERAWHERKPFKTLPTYWLGIALLLALASAILFGFGCLNAAAMLGKI